MHPAEWHEKRRKGIGGSEWVSLMAIVDEAKYKYGCQRRIFYDKTGFVPDFPVQITAAMERGSVLEPIVHEMFMMHNADIELLEYHEWPPDVEFILPGEKRPEWWIGNPDGIYREDGELGIEELKTMNEHVFHTAAEEGLSDGYVMQPLHYMAMKGLKRGTIACLWPDGWGYFDMPAVWDPETIKTMLYAGNLFWDMIKAGKDVGRPIPTEYRCGNCPYRESCLGKGFYETHVLHKVNLSSDDSLAKLFERYTDLTKQEGDAKKRKEAIKIEILHRLEDKHGDPEHVICRGFELKVPKKTKKKFDQNRLVSHHPEVVKDVISEVPNRGFDLRRKKSLEEAWDLKNI